MILKTLNQKALILIIGIFVLFVSVLLIFKFNRVIKVPEIFQVNPYGCTTDEECAPDCCNLNTGECEPCSTWPLCVPNQCAWCIDETSCKDNEGWWWEDDCPGDCPSYCGICSEPDHGCCWPPDKPEKPPNCQDPYCGPYIECDWCTTQAECNNTPGYKFLTRSCYCANCDSANGYANAEGCCVPEESNPYFWENIKCGCNCSYQNREFSDYEFLGYPEVVTKVYEKNSTSKVVAQTKSYFYQQMETATCFKPSPIKGSAYKSITYNVDTGSEWSVAENKIIVRFGDMNDSSPTEIAASDLNSYCDQYNPEATTENPKQTVSIVLPVESRNKTGIGGQEVCTKTQTDYNNLDGTIDPYANPHKTINWGKVDCNSWVDIADYPDYTAKFSFSEYTSPNDVNWFVPRPKESWVTAEDNPAAEKYSHQRTYYDNQALGSLGNYARVTKTEVLKDGASFAVSTIAYEDNASRPWNVKSTTDPMNRTTTTTYDNVYHMFPKTVTNSLGQTSTTEYDFDTTDTSHPNYGGILGLPVKVTDPNGAIAKTVYDKFARPLETYLPDAETGLPASTPSTINEFYYYNQNEVSGSCDVSTNCLYNLGLNNTPKMVAVSKGLVGDGGEYSLSYTMFNGLGQQIQSRSSWLDSSGQYGIPVTAESGDSYATSLADLVTHQVFNGLGQAEKTYMASAVEPYNLSSNNSPYLNPADLDNIFTTFTYDGLGRQKTITYPDGSQEETVYEVNGNPLVTKLLDKNCKQNLYCTEKITSSDAFGQTQKVEEIVRNSSDPDHLPDGHVITTHYEYHPVFGSLTKTIDTKNVEVNRISYNSLGRKESMWDIDMGNWSYKYDMIGNLIEQTDAKGQVINLEYDDLDRLTYKKHGSTTLLQYVYDEGENSIGRKTRFLSFKPGDGKKVKEVSFVYDKRGQLLSQTQAFSNLPDSDVNGSFTTEYNYGIGGRILSTKYPEINLPGIESVPAETLYNVYNGPYLTQIMSGSVAGVETESQVEEELTPQALIKRPYCQPASGYTCQQQSSSVFNLRVGNGTFDENCYFLGNTTFDAGRKIQAIQIKEINSAGTWFRDFWVKEYDESLSCTNGCRSTGFNCTEDYTSNLTNCVFDMYGKICNSDCTNWTKDPATASFRFNFQYDDGRQTCADYQCTCTIAPPSPSPSVSPSPQVLASVSPSPSASPVLISPSPNPSIPGDSSILANGALYNKDGQLLAFNSGNGVVNKFSYDPLNLRLKNLKVNESAAADSKLDLTYDYDQVGNILGINDISGLPQEDDFYLGQYFDYDPLYRLMGTSSRPENAYFATYDYDDVGNILFKVEGESSADNETVDLFYNTTSESNYYHRPEQVSINGTIHNFQYDAVGNMENDGRQNYSYDVENRLQQVDKADYGTTSFIYDGEGQRISKTDALSNTTYYLSPMLEIIANNNGTYSWKKNYYFTGRLTAVREGGEIQVEPSPSPGAGSSDLNEDEKVDSADVKIWIKKFSDAIGIEDINGDGKINLLDAALIFKNWTE